MNDLNLSYLAGFFDGEGCISILKYSKDISKWNPSYFLQAQIETLVKEFGNLTLLYNYL